MPILAIAVLLGLVVAVVVTLVGVVAAVQHKRWGIVFAIPVLLFGAVSLVWTLTTNRAPDLKWAGAHVPVLPAIPDAPDAPIVSALPKVLIAASVSVTDEELEDVADAAPEIELDEVEVQAKTNEESSRPEWIDAPGDSNRFVITTDPYTSAEACKEAANAQLASALRERAGIDLQHLGDDPASSTQELVKRFVEERYLEKREVSVGEVYLMHTLVAFDDEDVAWLAERTAVWHRAADQQKGVFAVSIAGGALLSVVALVHVALRYG